MKSNQIPIPIRTMLDVSDGVFGSFKIYRLSTPNIEYPGDDPLFRLRRRKPDLHL